MYFSIAFITALAMGAIANPMPQADIPRPNEIALEARLWGSANCGAGGNSQNHGRLTLRGRDNNKCYKFNKNVKSIYQYDDEDDCELVLFGDTSCKVRFRGRLHDDQCVQARGLFRSYKLVCRDDDRNDRDDHDDHDDHDDRDDDRDD
ncbi:hypothetical protein ACHAPO_009721 [Fusarium lateritium]